MRKNILILSFFILTSLFSLTAQKNLELTHRHELKLNLGSSVFLSFPEISYEYILSEDMTVGAAMGFGFDEDYGDGYSFKATPFARWFFGRKSYEPATGFFLEANGVLGKQDVDTSYATPGMDYGWTSRYESKFAAGLGLAVGWKHLSKNNWTGELFMGMGRNFIYHKSHDDIPLYARIGISIGKRF